MKKIFIASDHAGYILKEAIYREFKIRKKKFDIVNLGPNDSRRVDYPVYAHKLALRVKKLKKSVGILICGSGTGMSITANKHKNIRSAQCYDSKSTKLSRLHNDANIITLGSRLLTKKKALHLVDIFLKTNFDGGRHLKRLKKI